MNQNPAGNGGKIIARRQQLSRDEMGANCEESAGGRENGYDWMSGEGERGSDLASLPTIQLKYAIMGERET